MLIYVGALYVLRTAQTSFSASAEGSGFKTAFQTTSPGLVLAALGVALILITDWRPVEYVFPARETGTIPQGPVPPIVEPPAPSTK